MAVWAPRKSHIKRRGAKPDAICNARCCLYSRLRLGSLCPEVKLGWRLSRICDVAFADSISDECQ